MQTNPRDITQTNEMISLIDDAIADSLGPDWTSFDAAHHVMQWLQDAGLQIVPAAFAEREARLVGALESAEQAIAEYYRYWTGGETRGSYDGKPERAGLWKAQSQARATLAALKDRTND